GQVEFTRLCLPAVLRHSRPPWEVVAVDFDSLDGTEHYLDGFAAAAPARVNVLRVSGDAPFADSLHQAFTRAQGEFLALLANDTLVTDGWLDQLTALAASAPDIGLVGAMSNHAPPPQYAGPAPYHDDLRKELPRLVGLPRGELFRRLETVERYAADWRQQ